MKKGVVITIIVIFAVIIISVVAWLIYRSSKKKSEAELVAAQNQLAALQAQLANPALPAQEKQTLLTQIGNLGQILQSSGIDISNLFKNSGSGNPPVNPAVQPPGFPLKKASGYSPLAQNLQAGLNKKCNSRLVADGKFGNLTEAALMKCYNVNQADFALYNQIIS
jgi:hypothetical protein